MKKMRKIIPALAMLLVSAVMMSTASFAWFTLSDDVTATGMQVQAKSAGGLMIAFAGKGDGGVVAEPASTKYSTNATFSSANDWYNGASQILPTSRPISGTNWFYGEAKVADSSAVNETGYIAVPTGNANQYYYQTQMHVKSLDDTDTLYDLYVNKVEVTATATGGSALEESIRVAINVGSTWLYFAPKSTATDVTTLKHVVAAGTGTDKVTAYAAGELYIGEAELTGAKLADNAVKFSDDTVVNVYIYFEGEDENCRSSFAYDLRELNVKVTLSTAD